MKSKPKSPFAIALAARRGDYDPNLLTGAARRLYNDKTLSRDQLSEYATEPVERSNNHTLVRTHQNFKRS